MCLLGYSFYYIALLSYYINSIYARLLHEHYYMSTII